MGMEKFSAGKRSTGEEDELRMKRSANWRNRWKLLVLLVALFGAIYLSSEQWLFSSSSQVSFRQPAAFNPAPDKPETLLMLLREGSSSFNHSTSSRNQQQAQQEASGKRQEKMQQVLSSWQVFVPPKEREDEEEEGGLTASGEWADEASSKRKMLVRRKRRSSALKSGDRKPILNDFSFPPNLIQGMRFVLMCQILDGEAPIQIKWFKGDQEILPTSQQQQQQPADADALPELIATEELGASLLFRRVQAQHSGNYTCTANNQFGSASYSSSVSVKDLLLLLGARSAALKEGVASSSAEASGSDAGGSSSVDQPLAVSVAQQLAAASGPANFKLINSNHHVQTLENGSLAIRQVGREHEGLYLCEADNGIEPSLFKIVRLTVHQQAHFLDDIQLLVSSPDLLGSPSSLTSAIQLQQHLQQSALDFVTPAASSGQQQQQLQPTAIRYVRLSSSSSSNSTSGANLQPSSIRLICLPVGEQPLTLEWLKDGQLLHAQDLAQLASLSGTPSSLSTGLARPGQVSVRRNGRGQLESELRLLGLRRSDAGSYACSARNSFGRAERQLRLVVQEQPEAPQVVDVAHIGSRSVALRWLAPFDGNSPILKYLVEYRKLPADDGSSSSSLASDPSIAGLISEKLMPQAHSGKQQLDLLGSLIQPANQVQVQHTVHELQPLSRYALHVIAVNAIGKSRPSVALSLRTEEEVPSVVPALVEALVVSSSAIKLRWSVSYSPTHEIIDGFFVGYRSIEPPAPGAGNFATPTAASVQRNNGDSADSAATPAHSATSSAQPTFTYKTIRLSNQELQAGNQDGGAKAALLTPISSVSKTIQSSSSALSSASSSQGLLLNSFEYEISALERNTEYTILIQCFNRKGAGPTSDPVVFKTMMDDPPDKLSLSADELTESSIRLSWRFMSAPSSHGKPTRQVGELVDGFVLTFAKLLLLGSSGASKLGANSKYLQAESNELGLSVLAGAAARVSHNPPASGVLPNGSRMNHLLPVIPTGDLASPVDQWQAVQLAPKQRTHQLKSLDCGATYSIKIWAFNKIGNGQPSDPLTVSTRGKAPIAPDKRSFISINSTAVKLHLSAWYDGGCEINRFVIQYRARGQQEWLLLSSNILKEQVTVTIRDLLPANPYELLVVAFNQVGPTEVKYRFTTLDSEGRQVSPATGGSHSFLGAFEPALDEQDVDSDGVELYSQNNHDDANLVRREHWQEAGIRTMQVFRQLFGSPTALILSLCLFASLLLLVAFFRFNKYSSTTHNSGRKLPTSLMKQRLRKGPPGGREGDSAVSGLASSSALLPGGLNYTPSQQDLDDSNSSPRMTNGPQYAGIPFYGLLPAQVDASAECQYGGSVFCGPAMDHTIAATSADYQATLPHSGLNYSTVLGQQVVNGSSIYGTSQCPRISQQHLQTNTINRQQTQHDATNSQIQQQQANEQEQQCLIQMLIMGAGGGNNSQIHQTNQVHHQSSEQTAVDSSTYAQALNTLARHSTLGKQQANHSQACLTTDTLSHPLNNQQQQYERQSCSSSSTTNSKNYLTGKNQHQLISSSNLIDQSNDLQSLLLLQQQQQQQQQTPIIAESNNHHITINDHLDGQPLIQGSSCSTSNFIQDSSISSSAQTSSSNSNQHYTTNSNSSNDPEGSSSFQHENSALVTTFDQKNCDNLTQYDVPFRFKAKSSNREVNSRQNQQQKFTSICY